jgi:hypothetical protein
MAFKLFDNQVITTRFAVGSHLTPSTTCPAWLYAVNTPLLLPPRAAAFDSCVTRDYRQGIDAYRLKVLPDYRYSQTRRNASYTVARYDSMIQVAGAPQSNQLEPDDTFVILSPIRCCFMAFFKGPEVVGVIIYVPAVLGRHVFQVEPASTTESEWYETGAIQERSCYYQARLGQ